MGKVALVDDEDYEWLRQWKWSAGKSPTSWYARRNGASPKRERIYLHRLILAAQPGQQVDHINGDGLDNRRCNLRLCTRAQNNRNRGKGPTNTSGYKGVCWDKKAQRWRAAIWLNGKYKFLGHFDAPKDAALAYDEAALRLHGEFAKTNFGRS